MAHIEQLADRYIRSSTKLTQLNERRQISEQIDAAVEDHRIPTAIALGTYSLVRGLPFVFHGIRLSLAFSMDAELDESYPLDSFKDEGDNSQALARAKAVISSSK